MENKEITIETIIEKLKEHNPYGIEQVQKAYELAELNHRGVFRQSGEPYISHPLNVANILLDMEIWDPDTISAALLHDTIEDTDLTQEDISKEINPTTAKLVNGVTKMRRMNFNSKQSQNLANTRKIVNGLNEDFRIIQIKLADRLHNMRTLEFKSVEKQKENAWETLEIFVPLAHSLGMYRIKSELEDLSFKYLFPEDYKIINEKKKELVGKYKSNINEVLYKVGLILKEKNIPFEFKVKEKNSYQIFRKISQGYKIENIYDLYYIKILTDNVDNCYRILEAVHTYPPISSRFKEYINSYTHRTNLYQSLHTAIVGPTNSLIKVKVRTQDMDKVSAFGYNALVNKPNGLTRGEIQELIKNENQFAKRLKEIDESVHDDDTFRDVIREELLSEHVYPYSETGTRIGIPKGSTILDYVAIAFPEKLKHLSHALVNEREVGLDYVVRNDERIEIITGKNIDKTNWENIPTTRKAKSLIKTLT